MIWRLCVDSGPHSETLPLRPFINRLFPHAFIRFLLTWHHAASCNTMPMHSHRLSVRTGRQRKLRCYQLDDEDQVMWTHTGARSSYCPVSRNLVFTFQLVRKSKIRSLETWVLTRAETKKKPLMRVAFVLASKFQGRARKLRSSA